MREEGAHFKNEKKFKNLKKYKKSAKNDDNNW
jgi:hypothetical protein